MHVIDFFE